MSYQVFDGGTASWGTQAHADVDHSLIAAFKELRGLDGYLLEGLDEIREEPPGLFGPTVGPSPHHSVRRLELELRREEARRICGIPVASTQRLVSGAKQFPFCLRHRRQYRARGTRQ